MKAMVLRRLGRLSKETDPLEYDELPDPVPAPGEVLIHVSVCGVCHTELDEIEARLSPPRLPVVLGHQVVGRIGALGPGVQDVRPGTRVGVAWIHSSCGSCAYCLSGRENLCPDFRATGKDVNGGYATLMTAPRAFVYPIPEVFSDAEAAPLLCAGAIGFRSLRLSGMENTRVLGLTGFGASAHLVLKAARHLYPDSPIAVFSRSPAEQEFARELGAAWAGPIGAHAPWPIDCMIDTTPAWKPIVEALGALAPGGRLVINAIRKERADQDALLGLEYAEHLWMERQITSVANVAREDVRGFLELASRIPIRPEVQLFPLQEANSALRELATRKIRGAKVLDIAATIPA
jgi:propanol-preferring alcohol dehydrogenase